MFKTVKKLVKKPEIGKEETNKNALRIVEFKGGKKKLEKR